MFNLLNRVNLANPVSATNNTAVGQIQATATGYDARLAQLGLHFTF